MFSKIKNWFNNYWYYYKWGVIVVGAFILIIGICLYQCASREKYDANILYTGPHIFEVGEKDAISSAFEQIMNDYNGDGKKVADIIDLTAFTDDQINEAIGTDNSEDTIIKYAPYTADRVQQSFANAMTGDGYICLVDKYWYDRMYNNGALVPLSEVLGYSPDNMIDEYSVYLGDLDFYKFFSDSVGKLPADTMVCFRKMPTTSAMIGQKEAKKVYAHSMKLFNAMFEFKMP